ncbi:MAG TPA: PilC/PilY family type IV pilus protein [Solimonas sp.]|nr:PilC/PilY family type IV pilus protein [Solimonas sp.]
MNKQLAAALAIVAALATSAARAEDIDLFSMSNPSAAGRPNVLFVIDNTANWNNAFANEMNALASSFQSLPPDAFNIGIMLYTETGGGNSGQDGGYVRAALRNMTATNKGLYRSMILNFDKLNDKSNGGKAGMIMAEAFLYLKGTAPSAGNNKTKADFTGNTCGDTGLCDNLSAAQATANKAVYALPGNALNTKASTLYNAGVGSGCAKNFIIYISNGPPQEANADIVKSNGLLAAQGGNTATISLAPADTGSETSPSDEWARFMRTSTPSAKTYAIDVLPSSTGGQYPGWRAVLKSMARQGGGDNQYFLVDPNVNGGADLAIAIGKILSEIQAVNTVFASVSLPVSVNTQGSFLNQVYVGLFRPDGTALPRWSGNLKQYKLNLTGNTLKLVDAADQGAINTSTGFITQCARSFWTPTAVDSYWTFKPLGSCLTGSKNSNTPDGDVVEKGGHGYMLRGAASPTAANPRTVKTCDIPFASCTVLTNFTNLNTNITQAALGAASAAERTSFIEWERGTDVQDENAFSPPAPAVYTANFTEVRPSAHGDVVHSRPVALNFGPDANPKVGIFYGGNDGVFRTVNGNRTNAIGTVPAGAPLFEFVPPEFFGSVKRLVDNSPVVGLPGVIGGTPKPYGMDGPVIGYDAGASRFIYATMRRGGRAMYAFGVDSANPATVSLKWKRGCPNQGDDTGCTAGLTGFGQTWASPTVTKIPGYGSPSPVLIFGGGYDTCEDDDTNPTSACATPPKPKGNHVYVLDADTGVIVKTFDTARSVVADVLIVPDSVTGLAKYGYTADLGGNIYRITFGSGAPATWTMTTIASLGCATPTTCAHNRKFMFGPDVLEGDNGEFILLVGSGDREKPIEFFSGAAATTNHFYMLRDKPSDATWLSAENGNCGANVMCLNSLLSIPSNAATPTAAQLAAKKGWYLGLGAKEQVVTSAITIFGVVNFSTHEPEPPPAAGSCTAGLGKTRLYRVNADSAASENGTANRFQVLPPVGLPPSPVAGMVTLDTGLTVPFCIGCDATSPLEANLPLIPASATPKQPKSRTYWYIEQ